MSMKPVLLSNRITVKGDGSSTSVAISLASDPVFYNDPNMAVTFSLLTTHPSAVFGVTSSSGQTVTSSYNALLGVLTVTYQTAIASGSYDVLTMHFEF